MWLAFNSADIFCVQGTWVSSRGQHPQSRMNQACSTYPCVWKQEFWCRQGRSLDDGQQMSTCLLAAAVLSPASARSNYTSKVPALVAFSRASSL